MQRFAQCCQKPKPFIDSIYRPASEAT
jgi:hypothetical protein